MDIPKTIFEDNTFARRLTVIFMVMLLSFNSRILADSGQENTPKDLFDMSLEELMDIEVTTASKTSQGLLKTGAAVYVVTAEDIHRSGATSVPEVLRMVPGVEVAQINSNTWAISIRGFNYTRANKLLVMIDGRSIYTLTYGGVYWDMHDVMLEDVERIEVIRGPGGTLWGSNAVNGIINIITKKAKDTQGLLLSAGGGTEEQGFGSLRYGGKINKNTYYRVYSKYFNRDDRPILHGSSGADRWNMHQGGFRVDWDDSDNDKLTLQGDMFDNHFEEMGTLFSLSSPYSTTYAETSKAFGGNILGRWEHTLKNGSDTTIQFYYDRTERREELYDDIRDTFDLDFQHHFLFSDTHEITWGWGIGFQRSRIVIQSVFL